MKLVAMKNHQDWQMYGYEIESFTGIWWSMKVYPNMWQIPMSRMHGLNEA